MQFNYDLGGIFSFSGDQKISISYDHRISNSGDGWNNYFNITIEYKKTFNAPISRIQGISKINGRIYDRETNEPFPNVIVKIGELSSITDEDGYYNFPAVFPGNYYITIDRSTIPLYMIPVQEIPIMIDVESDEDLYQDISLVKSAKISGNVILYDFDEENKQLILEDTESLENTVPEIKEVSGYPNIVIELTDGIEVLRRVTDKDGFFIFDELRPGNWTLLTILNDLPEYHYFEKETFEFEIEPNDSENIIIRILPQKRTIRFLETEPILIE